jgi:hypothetical protein
MGDLAWLPYAIAAAIIAIVGWFTFRRVPDDAEHHTHPPDTPR